MACNEMSWAPVLNLRGPTGPSGATGSTGKGFKVFAVIDSLLSGQTPTSAGVVVSPAPNPVNNIGDFLLVSNDNREDKGLPSLWIYLGNDANNNPTYQFGSYLSDDILIRGPDGPVGPTGPNSGFTGATGATGATGSTGKGFKVFAVIDSLLSGETPTSAGVVVLPAPNPINNIGDFLLVSNDNRESRNLPSLWIYLGNDANNNPTYQFGSYLSDDILIRGPSGPVGPTGPNSGFTGATGPTGAGPTGDRGTLIYSSLVTPNTNGFFSPIGSRIGDFIIDLTTGIMWQDALYLLPSVSGIGEYFPPIVPPVTSIVPVNYVAFRFQATQEFTARLRLAGVSGATVCYDNASVSASEPVPVTVGYHTVAFAFASQIVVRPTLVFGDPNAPEPTTTLPPVTLPTTTRGEYTAVPVEPDSTSTTTEDPSSTTTTTVDPSSTTTTTEDPDSTTTTTVDPSSTTTTTEDPNSTTTTTVDPSSTTTTTGDPNSTTTTTGDPDFFLTPNAGPDGSTMPTVNSVTGLITYNIAEGFNIDNWRPITPSGAANGDVYTYSLLNGNGVAIDFLEYEGQPTNVYLQRSELGTGIVLAGSMRGTLPYIETNTSIDQFRIQASRFRSGRYKVATSALIVIYLGDPSSTTTTTEDPNSTTTTTGDPSSTTSTTGYPDSTGVPPVTFPSASFRGAWNNGVSYIVGDTVDYLDQIFYCVTTNQTGNIPAGGYVLETPENGITPYWSLVDGADGSQSTATFRGEWSDSNNPYSVGDTVAYSGNTFYCIVETMSGVYPGGGFLLQTSDPNSTPYWSLVYKFSLSYGPPPGSNDGGDWVNGASTGVVSYICDAQSFTTWTPVIVRTTTGDAYSYSFTDVNGNPLSFPNGLSIDDSTGELSGEFVAAFNDTPLPESFCISVMPTGNSVQKQISYPIQIMIRGSNAQQ